MKKRGKIILIAAAISAVIIVGVIYILSATVPTSATPKIPNFLFETEQAELNLPVPTNTDIISETSSPDIPESEDPEIYKTSETSETTLETFEETVLPDTEETKENTPAWDPHKFLTSNDPLHQIEITLDGFTITAVGRYEGCSLVDMKLNVDNRREDGMDREDLFSRLKTSPDIKENDDGSFEAVLYNEALEKEPSGFCTLLLVFADNETLETYLPTYRLALSEEGLLFPDVREVIENNSLIASTPLELPENGVKEYICAGGSDEDIQNTLAEVKALSDKICAGITDEYEKLRAIASWVSENIYYDFDARDTEVTDETVCLSHLLETHRSICIGFTNLFTALCAAQDIECYNIRGSASTGASYAEENAEYELHETAYAVIDGRRIWVDVVWNTWNTYSHGKYNKDQTYFKYFDITEQVYALDHWARSCEHRDYFGVLQ